MGDFEGLEEKKPDSEVNQSKPINPMKSIFSESGNNLNKNKNQLMKTTLHLSFSNLRL